MTSKKKVPGRPEVLGRFVDRGIAGVGVALAADDRRVEVLFPARVADHSINLRDAQGGGRRARGTDRGPARLRLGARRAQGDAGVAEGNSATPDARSESAPRLARRR